MKRFFVGLAGLTVLAATSAAPAAAQRIRVGVRYRTPGVEVSGYYAPPDYHRAARYLHCEQDRRFRYCWDAGSYWTHHREPVTVHVYPVYEEHGRRYVARHDRAGRNYRPYYDEYDRHEYSVRYHHKAARKALRKWEKAHRHAHRHDRRHHRHGRAHNGIVIRLDF